MMSEPQMLTDGGDVTDVKRIVMHYNYLRSYTIAL